MDDQNPQNQQGAGTNPGAANPPQGDATLPWMNFSPDGAAMPAAGTPADAGTAGGASFDPFGNPFATPQAAEDTAAAFAPSTQDGSLATGNDMTFNGGFVPSEPSAFTPTFEETQPATVGTSVETAAPEAATPAWMNETAAPETATQTGGSMLDDDTDALSMLGALKARFEEEEEEFNKEVEEHNLNIQYEKDAISKLRAERSERLSQMREIVRGLDDLLGMRKPAQNERSDNKNNDHRNNAPRTRNEEPRKAERMAPKKQDRPKPVDDFLAA